MTNKEAFDQIELIAQANGFVSVKQSARVWLVIKIVHSRGYRGTGDGKYYTEMCGEIVCRGRHAECMKFIADNTEPIPKSLVDDCLKSSVGKWNEK